MSGAARGVAALDRIKALLKVQRVVGESSELERSRERYRRVLMAMVATGGTRIVQFVVNLITVPLALRYLGKEQYGVWITLTSFVPILAFVYRGIGDGLVQAIAEAEGRDDRAAAQGYFASAFFLSIGLAAVLAVGTIILMPLIDWQELFGVDGVAAAQARIAALTLVLVFCLTMVVNVVHFVFAGLQDGVVNGLIGLGASLMSLLGMVVVVESGLGLPHMVGAWAGAALVPTGLAWVYLLGRRRSWFRFGWSHLSRWATRRIFQTGGYMLLVQLALTAGQPLDYVIGARVLGAEAIAGYAVCAKLFLFVQLPLMMVLTPLWPAYGEALARGDSGWAARAFRRAKTLVWLGGSALCLPLVIWGEGLSRLWTGEVIDAPLPMLAGLGAGMMVSVAGSNASLFLAAAGTVRAPAIWGVIMLVASILARVVFVDWFGLVGLPWAMACAHALLFLVPVHVMVSRRLSSLERQAV